VTTFSYPIARARFNTAANFIFSLQRRHGLGVRPIEYSEIKKVTTNTTLFVGLKLSLSIKGIVVHYGKYEAIFISPQEQEKFLEMLKEKNPTISIN
jgi:hypothetical protein